ncbi:uncharacterized protein BP01DRAFT_393667 [Aspergillus saccharolyticus JOP 1030-1]|uniref:Uncharacterized protein n=1 Tax=Aspergillus saccharolyticus JOP 1030-1 TaxID=1450539 RepID=A0A318ZHC9_9EURO|nr:hypothetical protein BP01DRAFT_393667 [Aspergillus saccharolyticus JOP 1030-1]PYH43090.1 hypothetical protein BP01DRAFT_393667 [Aspergillus saccharolyticus JOP 1030-1]
MFLRNRMSMHTEGMIHAQPVDACILIGASDKTVSVQTGNGMTVDVDVEARVRRMEVSEEAELAGRMAEREATGTLKGGGGEVECTAGAAARVSRVVCVSGR